ncbi:MAG: hypothetical protein GC162_09210 [Planctomycetes bacterium]|nr:hypothetical protein [Planctomycetota bacterium]
MGRSADRQSVEVRRPIASLISKSEKALGKLAPGTWQHDMLRDNLRALHLASALLNGDKTAGEGVTSSDLHPALAALGAMIRRVEKARAGLAAGTSQHTLQQNRLKALRIARTLVREKVEATAAARREKLSRKIQKKSGPRRMTR